MDNIKEIEKALEEIRGLVINLARSSNEETMDEADALAYLKVSKRCLANWRERGVLPFHKLGGKIYYFKPEIDDAIRTGKVKFKNTPKF